MLHIHQVQRGTHTLRELLSIIVGPEVHEEEVRIVLDHVTVERGHFDTMLTQGPQNRIDLTADHYEIAGDGCLATAGRLEIDGCSSSHGRRHGHTALGDCLDARHADLINTSVDSSLKTERLFQRGRIQVNRSRLAGWRARWSHWGFALRKRGMEDLGELHGITMPTHVHVEDRHGGTKQMVVDRGDFDVTSDQPCHYRTDLAVSQHQIAHEHGAGTARLERDPATQRQSGFDRNTIDGNTQIRARERVLVNATGLVRAFSSDSLVHLSPVDIGAGGCGRDSKQGNQSCETVHLRTPVKEKPRSLSVKAFEAAPQRCVSTRTAPGSTASRW